MIFVTVGTHEQPFDRLVKEMDHIAKNDLLGKKIVIQKGYTQYIPQYCQYQDFFSYDEMNRLMDEASIIITHGGPSTFMEVTVRGKIPIVVPRIAEFGEHVNNHQLDFLVKYTKKNDNVVPIYSIKNLLKEIMNLNNSNNSNLLINTQNSRFINKFNEVICSLMEK